MSVQTCQSVQLLNEEVLAEHDGIPSDSDCYTLDLVIRKTETSLHGKQISNGFSISSGSVAVIDSVKTVQFEQPSHLNRTRRNATEGSDSRNPMEGVSPQDRGSISGNRLGETMTRLDITCAANKFLLGTMDALAHKDDMMLGEGDMSRDRTQTNQIQHDRNQENGSLHTPFGTQPYHTVSLNTGSSEALNLTQLSGPILSRRSDETCLTVKKSPPNRCSRPPLLPPCRVCGDRASGYHYGVNTCEACKGFFRRSICKTEPYVCNGNGDCKTVAGKRTVCSHCRFKRCVEVGMSKSAIKTGRYTHELRSKNILEVKRLQRQQDVDEMRIEENPVSTFDGETLYSEYKRDLFKRTLLEETLQLLTEGQKQLFEFLDDYYNDQLIQERQIQVYNAFLEKKKQIEERIKETIQGQVGVSPFSMNTSDNSNQKCVQNTADCEKKRPSSEDSVNDVSNNVKCFKCDKDHCEGQQNNTHLTSADSCCTQSDGNCTDSENTVIKTSEVIRTAVESVKADVMTKIITDMEQGVQGTLAFAKCLPGFEELPKDDQASLLKASRFDIWYIGHIRCFNVELRVGACEWQFHAEELAQVWGNDLVDLAFVLSRVAQTLELTKQETAVLRAVCLTFTDRCVDLQQRDRVEEMHVFMLDVFKYISCKRHNNYNKWFTKIINFLVLLREFGVKFEKVSSQLKLDWSVLKDNPLLLSVFLS